ncbi:MAG: cell division topological specificity factor MinE [Anaerolineae bacterium]|nr:cell division topological specificity factor MinE [Anaerolineae bacterium]
MAGFFDRMLGRSSSKGSGSTAKQRLQFILVHDRINLPPERLQAMKAEILAVISKYVSIDSDNVDIALQQRDRDSVIVAEIPFISEVLEKDEARRRMAQDKAPPGDESHRLPDDPDDG